MFLNMFKARVLDSSEILELEAIVTFWCAMSVKDRRRSVPIFHPKSQLSAGYTWGRSILYLPT